MLSGAGLAAHVTPAFVVALLFIGLSLTSIPLVRRFPMSAAPSLALPSPRLPGRRRSSSSGPSAGRDGSEEIRRSTEAMVARLRVGQEALTAPERHPETVPAMREPVRSSPLRDPAVAGADAPTLLNRVD
jgi:hypothetical protein